MNYYGLVNHDNISEKRVYDFLKTALHMVNEDNPFRGPDHLKKGDFEYFLETEGTIERFSGVERILFKGSEVYKLIVHGGLISDR